MNVSDLHLQRLVSTRYRGPALGGGGGGGGGGRRKKAHNAIHF